MLVKERKEQTAARTATDIPLGSHQFHPGLRGANFPRVGVAMVVLERLPEIPLSPERCKQRFIASAAYERVPAKTMSQFVQETPALDTHQVAIPTARTYSVSGEHGGHTLSYDTTLMP
jgi:hypothetical protein